MTTAVENDRSVDAVAQPLLEAFTARVPCKPVVLTGALGPMAVVRSGDSVCATIWRLGEASVRLTELGR